MKLTRVKDYVEQVHKEFPELSEKEVYRILIYGWKMILQYVNAGNSVQVKDSNTWMFIGQLTANSLTNFKTYCFKLSKRIKYMFKRTQAKWDGYYYFARTENQYKDYLSQNRKKKKIFKNVMLYKLLEEVRIKEYSKPYIFRLSEDKTSHMSKFYPEIITSNAELIECRDPLNMQDILVTKNKFKYIQQK